MDRHATRTEPLRRIPRKEFLQQGGMETVRMQDGNIVETVRECCAQFADLSDRGITLTLHTHEAAIIARFDRDKIQKIVTNLLSNAYKFAPQNGRVDVSVGIILADDMGLCKTLQITTFLQKLKDEKLFNKKYALVVAPTGLLERWQVGSITLWKHPFITKTPLRSASMI